ncbi:nucleotidyltransferase family protein [Marinobacter sp.]|jgi:dTDP-glucose pyrophosphorylase/predicted transcriptional regulator|uniref:nucleotidyltransferase family protein n=1 Tax=Marinobacter sp. TaxID=50741 RepID=UPI000C4646E2|nr:nucleotidyltransferase family protein [Marinobacter sp.]MAB50718.1 alcohol dehydrogenase [Marinobacter sp.]MBN15324.1 alcohol dehydrogenase [Pelagibacterium sp.]|tara:strand:- start:168 stop:1223 length:1056 start_codon:yes stop_codon:yes gene_type:complete
MKQWRDALVNRDASLEQAIEVLDKAALRIALVVDEAEALLGTLTDGDVRRALLRHLSLDTPVHEVMNTNPKTAGEDWTESRILAVMEQYEVLQLPLVDGDQKIVGLANLHDLLNKHRHDNPVFLMAGGFGTRLRPLTNNCPKPMLKVGDKPILEQILQNFVSAGFHRFYISTHYMPEVIRDYFGNGEKWGISIKYIHEDEPLGTGGALGLLPHDEIDQPLFMMNGDLLTSLNIHSFLEFHENHDSIATMCVREYEHQVPYGVITSEGAQIKSMVEKPVHKFFVNAGIYLLNPELVKSVEQGARIDMPTLLGQQIDAGKPVNMFPIHEYWLDIGRMDDFQRAQNEVESTFNG